MPGRRLTLAACLTAALFIGRRQSTPNLDFENGLAGWVSTGSAFDAQPVSVELFDTSDETVPVSLGGDYWRGLSYPLGASGAHFIRTSDIGRGTLTSADLVLDAGQRFFSVLIGGSADGLVRLELQIRTRDAGPSFERDGDYYILRRFAGRGAERLHRDTLTIPAALVGQSARLKIIDDSDAGHISVDDARFTDAPVVEARPPLWGVADAHTHPMNHMAFGGLNGIRTIWGVPGSAYADYSAGRRSINADLPRCTQGHGGGNSAELFINVAEGRFAPKNAIAGLIGLFFGAQHHGGQGAPTFADYPSFQSGTHHQMHVTQMHRAWEGGLRLMVAIAVHNTAVEFLVSDLTNGQVNPSTERQVLDAQVCGMRDLARLNQDWMEIAYSPADARRIIEQNKLAIVLGVEMDDLGRLDQNAVCTTLAPCPFATLADEVDYLWNLGIRQVTPIHAIDNRLGGAALFQPVYNSLNDFLNRGKINVEAKDLKYWPPRFFDAREGGCERGPYAGQRGECVTYRFEQAQQRLALMKAIKTRFKKAPFLEDVVVPSYYGIDGMMNVNGLTADGRSYLKLLMRRGMVVGMEHMSQKAANDVSGVVAELLVERGHSDCATFGTGIVPASCYEAAHPLVVSHAHFRALSVYGRDSTTNEGFRPTEYEVSDRQAALMGATGGLAGQFTGEDPIIPPKGFVTPPALVNDCAGSSKGFVLSHAYALQRMGGGVALATDFTIITSTSPRFGKYACWAYASATDQKKEKEKLPTLYAVDSQKNPVVYDYAPHPASGLGSGQNSPLTPYVIGEKRKPFDFNVEGFAHYGLLPDLLQDARNVGMTDGARASLFTSAEYYVQTWEKVGRASLAGFPGTFEPVALACDALCRGLCPSSPNAGAPARPN